MIPKSGNRFSDKIMLQTINLPAVAKPGGFWHSFAMVPLKRIAILPFSDAGVAQG
jgi:hypothetical protein